MRALVAAVEGAQGPLERICGLLGRLSLGVPGDVTGDGLALSLRCDDPKVRICAGSHVQHLRPGGGGDADGERVGPEDGLVGTIGSDHLRALRHDDANQSRACNISSPATQCTGRAGIVGDPDHRHATDFGLFNCQIHRLAHDHHADALATVDLGGYAGLSGHGDLARGSGGQSSGHELDQTLVVTTQFGVHQDVGHNGGIFFAISTSHQSSLCQFGHLRNRSWALGYRSGWCIFREVIGAVPSHGWI
mmetsp:Transcript_20985/g.42632  ORF Transcript_20985/g.42632 Transcript_20985/m.42632 type:complete len:248 (-) Transcript_20985:41-784(-)